MDMFAHRYRQSNQHVALVQMITEFNDMRTLCRFVCRVMRGGFAGFVGWSALRVWRAKSLSETFDTQRLPVSDMGTIKESVDDRYALCLDMLFRVCGARK